MNMTSGNSQKKSEFNGGVSSGYSHWPATSEQSLRKIRELDLSAWGGKRLLVFGWIHKVIDPKRNRLLLRDGTGFLLCDLTKAIINDGTLPRTTSEPLQQETTVELAGVLRSSEDGHNKMELVVDKCTILGFCNEEAFREKMSTKSFHYRHLHLRNDTFREILLARSAITTAFRQHFLSIRCVELTPPTLIPSLVEAGCPMFAVDYFGDHEAFLTPSSQLYLETALPSLGDVFCVLPSFRLESTYSRRHLAEYNHIEAEFAFIKFNDLLNKIEEMIVDVIRRVMTSPAAAFVLKLNPRMATEVLQRPFKRLTYAEAIEFLQEQNIRKLDGSSYCFGDDIAAESERTLTDHFAQPILLTKFPLALKSFDMQLDPNDSELTESVDLLLPGVGESVGGAIRLTDWHKLEASYRREGLDPKDYYWLLDQRRIGTCPHGGFGVGLDRVLMWLLNRDHITDVVAFPRAKGFTGCP